VYGLSRNETYYDVISVLPRHFLEALSIAAILPISAVFVLLDRPLQAMLPLLALFGVAVVRLVPAINSINMALVDIRYKRSAFDLICGELKTLEASCAGEPELSPGQNPTVAMQQGIRLTNVWYRYPGADGDAISDLSLEIRTGEAVGFIGPSGAGKSTLIDLIVGLLTPTGGAVRVDGQDIRRNLSAWQRQIGYIPQEIYLNDDTIRRNIAFGLPDERIDDHAVARALRAAQLEDFVRGLPQGLDTLIGNQGIRLSGGQRQRIAIARALYHDPNVLVMDEATNALDSETESDVMDAVQALRGSKTLIIVAHRRSSVAYCDRLFRFEQGRIVDVQDAETILGGITKRIA
jgi:ABC-type multidrug transport system fused ATPase/permease subunit